MLVGLFCDLYTMKMSKDASALVTPWRLLSQPPGPWADNDTEWGQVSSSDNAKSCKFILVGFDGFRSSLLFSRWNGIENIQHIICRSINVHLSVLKIVHEHSSLISALFQTHD